ncbi:ATP-dependent DNA ligase [Aminobacter aminovorans]|uniref:ATP-dependent DNA ligase n=1 Tax=Aminobacter aminovorans TaxID=83263 RepID=A0AAC8YMZ4_AMIAI|nr:RNA ligase family protein [Aminobacter aminovorans]AMS41138.1 hypothetical protein AA2016_2208 [Aminobacter aminovorans]MBB3705882.1 ATP-dependent DNA ligase [Aminobacter aminovorans]
MKPAGFLPFCFPTEVDKPPEGEAWSHEIKYDGYRTQLQLGQTPRALTRNGVDWSSKYPFVLAAANAIVGGQDAVLDGEIVVLDEIGRADFSRLPGAIRWKKNDLVFYAFDLLLIGDDDIRGWRCEDRRSLLRDTLGAPSQEVRFSDDYDGSGAELFAKVAELEVEGVVSKRRASRYKSGDSRDWLKTKTYAFKEFVVVGYERKRGAAPSLLLADGMKYMGRAIPAVSAAQRDELWRALEFLHTDKFSVQMGAGNKEAVPVVPLLRVIAKHLRGEAKLRHATVTEILPP